MEKIKVYEGAAERLSVYHQNKKGVVEIVLMSEVKIVGTFAFLDWMYQPENYTHTGLCVTLR